ncbi:MAG: NeuD/PglB/VioB family sugar acetyltransferase [Bryobacteraceae bacterium]|nr:NeuD/PglB/VioB family sugar acetyltransferase [Bryobacteraceae bacterium]
MADKGVTVRELVIWGAGGHGKVVADAARGMGVWDGIRFVDDGRRGGEWFGCAVVGVEEVAAGAEFVVAVGSNAARARCLEEGLKRGWRAAVVVHRSAVVAEGVALGEGTVVLAGAVVNADARVGRNVIVNTGAVVEHDCEIGEGVHVSPGSVLGGGVKVGAGAQVGIGAVVLPGVRVGEGAMVGAGAVVVRDVGAGVTVVGVPARELVQKT